MPKTNRETTQKFNNRMVKMFPNVLDVEASILFCRLCQCNINGNKVYSVHQHFRTLKHRAALEVGTAFGTVSAPSKTFKVKLDTFSLDLCTTFLESSIPLETVDNPTIQMFLEKYTEETIPSVATLRAEYIPALYEKYVQKLQHKVKNKLIWVSITESIDSDQHLLANFVFGLLEEKGKSYLLNVDRLERANATSFAAFFIHSLQILWPEKILYENIYLVVTESKPHIVKAIQSLKILYPNMIYVNCLLEAIDRIVEFIRIHFRHVDTFITNCEAVFLTSPYRLHLMRSKYHYINLPSIRASPVTAATWLNAAIYYFNNYTEISSLLNMLGEEDDAECIQQAIELMPNNKIETDLLYLKKNFKCIPQAFTQLESRDLTLNESLACIDLVRTAIQASERVEFINKFEQIISENSGLLELITINHSNNSCVEHKSNNCEQKFMLYKFVPIVSANIEHLSYANSLLTNKRKSLDLKNAKKEKCESRTNDNGIFDSEQNKSHSVISPSQLRNNIKREFSPQEEETFDSNSATIKLENNLYE